MDNTSLLSDHELLSLLSRENHTAYTIIYDRYHRLLYLHAYKQLGDKEDARDIIHDLFISLWSHRSELAQLSNLRAYLYAAVRNRILDFIARRQVRDRHLHSLQEFMDKGAVETDYKLRFDQLLTQVDREIAALPLKMQEVFKLSRNEALTHREIAHILNISELTVKKQVQNALKILKKRLGPDHFHLFF